MPGTNKLPVLLTDADKQVIRQIGYHLGVDRTLGIDPKRLDLPNDTVTERLGRRVILANATRESYEAGYYRPRVSTTVRTCLQHVAGRPTIHQRLVTKAWAGTLPAKPLALRLERGRPPLDGRPLIPKGKMAHIVLATQEHTALYLASKECGIRPASYIYAVLNEFVRGFKHRGFWEEDPPVPGLNDVPQHVTNKET